jgi:2,3-bisphosphoglycerate-independent phosphoglycerate mutase
MLDLKTGEIDKEHSTSPIPFILVAKEFALEPPKERNLLSLSGHVPIGVISDIAPTVLDLLGLVKPAEMNGVSLLPMLEKGGYEAKV